MKLNFLDWLVIVLVVVGALNWGLVGIWNFDVVSWLFVEQLNVAVVARVVYILVGVAGLYMIYTSSKAAK